MKAIVFEDTSGVKNFMVFESNEKLFEVFNKMCIGSGRVLCTSEEQFEKLKTECDYALLSEIIYKKFMGIGLYDWDGNPHDKIIQIEGTYCIVDYNETEKINNTNYIDFFKFKPEDMYFN